MMVKMITQVFPHILWKIEIFTVVAKATLSFRILEKYMMAMFLK